LQSNARVLAPYLTSEVLIPQVPSEARLDFVLNTNSGTQSFPMADLYFGLSNLPQQVQQAIANHEHTMINIDLHLLQKVIVEKLPTIRNECSFQPLSGLAIVIELKVTTEGAMGISGLLNDRVTHTS
jgi:hypothetical protein